MQNPEIEKLLESVENKLKETSGPVKQIAEQALNENKKNGELMASTKVDVDKLLKQQGELVTAQKDLTDRLETLDTRNQELEQQIATRTASGSDAELKSMGQAFIESEEIKSFMESGKGSASVNVSNAIMTAQAPRWPDQEEGVVAMAMRQLRIRNLLSPGRTGTDLVKYRKQSVRTNNAANRAEGAASAESAYEWTEADAPVRSITHHINVAKESYSDAAYLAGEIDTELRYGLDLKEDTQLLSGDGVGQNLSGLVTNATAYAAAFAVTNETMIDIIRLGLLQASLNEFPADGIIMHPTDLAYIELLKDANNQYIYSKAQDAQAARLWGVNVVQTQSMTEDKFLAGAFRTAGTIYDRKDTEILISSEHSDNFIKGMLTIQADKRLAMAVKRPEALVYGDLGRIA